MIALLCSTIPQNITADETVKEATSLFCARENVEYFNRLKGEKNDDGVKESFFAIIALANALKMLPLRTLTEDLVFGKSATGKPYFENSHVHFSISHSKGRVVCAVSDSGDVGVDTECADISDEKAKKLANRYFAKEDVAAVENDPKIFKEMWCEKEATTKFFGKELSIFLKEERERENCQNFAENEKIAGFCSIHRFVWDNNPVILCSECKNSTIIFKILSNARGF